MPTKTLVAMAFLSVALCGSVAIAQTPPSGRRIITYPSDEGVQLAMGWDFARNKKMLKSCVIGEMVTDAGQDKTLTFKRVVDTDSLMTSLAVSAEAKASGIFGGSGSASANFSRSVSLANEDVNISANALVLHEARHLVPQGAAQRVMSLPAVLSGKPTPMAGRPAVPDDFSKTSDMLRSLSPNDPKLIHTPELLFHVLGAIGGGQISLTPEAEQLAKGNMAEFLNVCGDGFIATLINGGSIDALYQFHSRESKEREEFAATMSGSFTNFSLSGSIKTVLDKYAKSAQTKISYRQLGGSGEPLPITLDQFESAITNLPAAVAKAPRLLRMTVIPYSQLPNFPNPGDATKSDIVLITTMYYRISSLALALDPILANPASIIIENDINIQNLRTLRDSLEAFRTTLREQARSCLDGNPCTYPADVPKNDYEVRSHFPVSSGSFEADIELQKARAELAAAPAIYAATPKCMPGIPAWPVPPPEWCAQGGPMENPARGALRAVMASLPQKIASLEVQRPLEYVTTRYRFLIDEPARARCKEEYDNPCFSEREMQELYSAMLKRAGIQR